MNNDISVSRCGITALGSGSGGNAYVLHCGEYNYLVDAGFTRKELCRRMEQCHIAPESVKAVLISHDHGDHVKGCRVFADEFEVPAYVTTGAADYLYRKKQLPQNVVEFAPGIPFELPGVTVHPFPVQHDALSPVGFEFTIGSSRIALATDLGCLDEVVLRSVSAADILILEANYDLRMLLESDRRPTLKHRIMGSSGHLDNLHALQALPELLGPRTRSLLLAHISRECNDPELVAELFTRELAVLNRTDIDCRVLTQDTPDSGVWL